MKVAIAGFGLEGESSYRYYSARGDDVTILDQRDYLTRPVPPSAEVRLGERAFDNLNEFDLVLRTAGLHPEKLAGAKKVWSSTNEFFHECPAKIVGVTGTKGKSTTSTMIASIIEASGRRVHLLGNIGTTPLDELVRIEPDDIVVFELSSFQLWDLEYSPHVAVVLPVGSDHLDIHGTQQVYVAAKANIVQHQNETDVVVYDPENQPSRQIAESSAGTAIAYNSPESKDSVYISDDAFWAGNSRICSTHEVQLLGPHNLRNACAAAIAARAVAVGNDAIKKGLAAIEFMPHRMQFVERIDGVDYYDDNYSSSLLASLAAVQTFERPTVLILGGKDRGIQIEPLLADIAAQPHLKHIVCIGEVRQMLKDEFDRIGFENVTVVDDDEIQSVLVAVRTVASSGDVVVMSPGFASFDMFQNFTDRAEQFVYALKETA